MAKLMSKFKRKSKEGVRHDRLLTNKSPFSLTEAYRNVRTNLLFTFPQNVNSIVAGVVSSMPSEGKTTTTVNLSIVFAQLDKKVLIIDADLRKPRIGKFFKIKGVKGLSNYLSGQATIDEIIHETDYKNLSCIVAGVLPPNPAELLGTNEMSLLSDEVKEQFDYVFIDTPPIETVADALVLAPKYDAVVLVAKHNVSTHPALQKTIKKLEFADIKIAGMILNSFDEKASNYRYYKYNYKYKYKYEYTSKRD